jgi:hypothetical protein
MDSRLTAGGAYVGSPKFWPKETLEPVLAQYERDHPAPLQRPTPICTQTVNVATADMIEQVIISCSAECPLLGE